MTSDIIIAGVDAGNVMSLMLGFCIGYAFGRLHNRTEKAVHDAEVAIEEIAHLKQELPHADPG